MTEPKHGDPAREEAMTRLVLAMSADGDSFRWSCRSVVDAGRGELLLPLAGMPVPDLVLLRLCDTAATGPEDTRAHAQVYWDALASRAGFDPGAALARAAYHEMWGAVRVAMRHGASPAAPVRAEDVAPGPVLRLRPGSSRRHAAPETVTAFGITVLESGQILETDHDTTDRYGVFFENGPIKGVPLVCVTDFHGEIDALTLFAMREELECIDLLIERLDRSAPETHEGMRAAWHRMLQLWAKGDGCGLLNFNIISSVAVRMMVAGMRLSREEVRAYDEAHDTPLVHRFVGIREEGIASEAALIAILQLASAGADLTGTADGRTILHRAAAGNDTRLAELALVHGVPLDAPDGSGLSAMRLAEQGDCAEVLALLQAAAAREALRSTAGPAPAP